MNIDKDELLNDLQLVKPGLSTRDFLEQSSYFAFRDGLVMTFNDEIACRKKTKLNFTGAVPSGVLLSLLDKLPDKTLEVVIQNGEILFRGTNKRFGIAYEKHILLPVEKVEEELPSKWRSLPSNFDRIIETLKDCVGRDDNQWNLTCIHFHPEFIEACDAKQAMRWDVPLGLKRSILVRGDAMAQLVTVGKPTKVGSSLSWIHFRNAQGLTFSCRKFVEDYHELGPILNVDGHGITLPKSLGEMAERAALAANEHNPGVDVGLFVEIEPGRVRVAGTGLNVWYRESVKEKGYSGPKIQFSVGPALLKHVASKYNECQITEKRLKASGEKWNYVTMLSVPKKPGDDPPKESENESPARSSKDENPDEIPF